MADRVNLARVARERLERTESLVEVNMKPVLDVLDVACEVAEQLEALRLPVDDRQAKSNVQAEAGRQLNRLADLLQIAQAEVKSQYWALKGYEDPRS